MNTEIFDKYGNEVGIGDTLAYNWTDEFGNATITFYEVVFRFGMACVDISHSKQGSKLEDFDPIWNQIKMGAYVYRRSKS